MKKLILLAFVFGICFSGSTAQAGIVNRNVDGLTLTIHKMGSDKKEPLYKGVYSLVVDGNRAAQKLAITAVDGKPAASEELWEKDGTFESYSYNRIDHNEGGTVTIEGNKLHFAYTKEGKTEKKEIDLPERFVIGAWLKAYVTDHWDTILKGEELHINYGVLDRQDIYKFKLFKVGETTYQGKKAIVVKMKPATWVLALIVSPLTFTFMEDGTEIYELVGRTILLRDGAAFDGHTVYHHDLHHREMPTAAEATE